MRLKNIALFTLVGLSACSGQAPDRGSNPSDPSVRSETETETETQTETETETQTETETETQTETETETQTETAQLGPEANAALAQVDANLERLRALNLFEVGELVVQLPAEDAVSAARARAALRLQELASTAEAAAQQPSNSYLCLDRVDENLEALRALAIVEVGAFIRTKPQNNPMCYNNPCQSDILAADLDNEQRAAELESIARGANQL